MIDEMPCLYNAYDSSEEVGQSILNKQKKK